MTISNGTTFTTGAYGTWTPANPDLPNKVEAVAALGALASEPVQVAPGLYLLRDGHTVDLRPDLATYDAYRPGAKAGAKVVRDVPSFLGYLAKHATPDTEVWADAKGGKVTAVIDAHPADAAVAGWENHTVTLDLRSTDDWAAWTSRDGTLGTQETFAEFIEDHLANFVTPTGAAMLDLAQTFHASTAVEFESSKRVKSGETTLVYAETTTATAGRKGDIVIPDTFDLGLQVFDGGPLYKVTARLRYRITRDKGLAIGYRLTRPGDVTRDAFAAVITDIQAGTDTPIWNR